MNRPPIALRAAVLAAGALVAAGAFAAPAPEPEVKQRVHEDEGVRIEELRVRGQTQRIVVRPKTADVRPYQILPDEPVEVRRAGAGQRVWQILSF